MSRLLIRWLINAIALWVAIQIVPGLDYTSETGLSLLIIALIFGLVNALVRPVLVLLTCPLIVVTMGLFLLLINAAMLAITEWLSGIFDLGLTIDGFWPTFLGAVVISIVSAVINLLVKDEREERR